MYINNYLKIIIILIIPISSFVFGFINLEDSIGGAKRDFDAYEKYIWNFYNDFKETLANFGLNEINESYKIRNLPTFYILSSVILTLGFDVSHLRYFNLLPLIITIIFFNLSLNLKFKNPKPETIFFLISCLLLSPTIRSLINYPYPFLWGICSFTISIFYFLKFQLIQNNFFKNSILCVFYLAISSYFTPNFSVFILYFLYFFYLKFRINKYFLFIIIFSIILSLPAILFVILNDFYIFKGEIFPVTSLEKFNLFNKLIIISSFLIMFFVPFITFKKFFLLNLKNEILNIRFYLLIIFGLICLLFFDFKLGAGGGIFFQISNILLKNNLILFLSFILFLIIFYTLNLFTKNNVSILMILILYNLQYTIYYKYFDPLIIFVYLFLMNNLNFNEKYLNSSAKKLYLFYIIFLLANIYKVQVKQFLII
tara:strand:+ start:2142 stop:3419 length:1278 start_codon:yes stop_codon:yes gene_type:complete